MPLFRRCIVLAVIFAAILTLATPAHAAFTFGDHTPPKAPLLRYPPDGTELHNFPRRITLEWSPVSDHSRVSYYVQVDTMYPSNDAGPGVWKSQVYGPMLQNRMNYTHIGDQQGRWMVWAVDGANNTGPKSETRYFTFNTAKQATPKPTPKLVAVEPSSAVETATPPAMETIQAGTTGSDFFTSPQPKLSTTAQMSQDLVGGTAGLTAASGGEDQTPPPVVHPLSPADGAHLGTYPCEVKLSWSPVKDASSVTYTVEVQTVYPFEGGGTASRSQFYRNLTETSITHKHPGDYAGSWRVWAVDAAGNAGEPSAWRTFVFETTGTGARTKELSAVAGPMDSVPEAPVPAPLSHEVEAVAKAQLAMVIPAVTPRAEDNFGGEGSIPEPVMLSPRDGAIIDDDENYVICKWEAVEGARYTLEVQTYDANTGQWSSETYKNLSSTQKTADHTAPLKGRWRVQAVIKGAEGPWSSWRYFTYHGEGDKTDSPEAGATPGPYAQVAMEKDDRAPDSPQLLGPQDGALVKDANRRVDLTWSGVQDPSGVTYICAVETQSEKGWEVHSFPNRIATKLTYQNPGKGNMRWWVVAVDGAGNQSKASRVQTVTFSPESSASAPANGAPQPLAPTTGAAVAPGNIELSWVSIASQAKVEVQILEPRQTGGGHWKSAAAQDVSGNSQPVQVPAGQQIRWRAGTPMSDGSIMFCAWQYFETGY
mgnify:CR=1 FL=1